MNGVDRGISERAGGSWLVDLHTDSATNLKTRVPEAVTDDWDHRRRCCTDSEVIWSDQKTSSVDLVVSEMVIETGYGLHFVPGLDAFVRPSSVAVRVAS